MGNLTSSISQDLIETIDRVYNPWQFKCSQLSKEPEGAKYSAYPLTTQQWQINYFLEIPPNRPIDHLHIQQLYGIKQ